MTRKTQCCAMLLTAGVVSLTAMLSRPTATCAFTLTGESLSLDQRDVRVFDNFTDAVANDNTFPHPNFPGATGAPLAIWKAHAEWGSLPRGGNGLGDGLADNPVLGSGGANFDNTWQGLADGVGGVNDNVHSAFPSLGGALIALVQTPASDGWKIVYNDDFVWDDGPGAPVAGALDLQGVATHEVGLVLGLGNSTVAGATMSGALSGGGTSARSLAADDIAGLAAIYGSASAAKPVISALSGPLDTGTTLTLTGAHFAPAGNEVWFTQQGGGGTPAKVTGVPSAAGGTQLVVTIPADADAGEVLVKVPGSSGAALSNAFPIDIDAAPGAFALTGPGLGGAAGVPQLTGAGPLTPGGAPFTLFVQLAAPGAAGMLFVSGSEANLPFKGGVFDPAPVALALPVLADGAGKVVLAAAIPAGPFSGLSLVLQGWFADGAAVQGAAATNGLRLVIE
ncbi:MAG TPA: matrixin family metalloprotease [Planctomycetota bacterium]|nr:matrixin family metalloprotease [Planctomycetota bacterium]